MPALESCIKYSSGVRCEMNSDRSANEMNRKWVPSTLSSKHTHRLMEWSTGRPSMFAFIGIIRPMALNDHMWTHTGQRCKAFPINGYGWVPHALIMLIAFYFCYAVPTKWFFIPNSPVAVMHRSASVNIASLLCVSELMAFGFHIHWMIQISNKGQQTTQFRFVFPKAPKIK